MAQTFNQLFADTFTRANAATLGSNWIIQAPGPNNIFQINGNQAQPLTDAVNVCSAVSPISNFPYDQYAELKIATRANSSNLLGPMVRMSKFAGLATSGTAAQGYCAMSHIGGTTYSIYSFGGFTPAGAGLGTRELATSSQAVALNDVVRVIVQGSTISFTVNGVAIVTSPATVTDTALNFGYPGMFAQSNAGAANIGATNFACGSVNSVPTIQNPSSASNQYVLLPQTSTNLGQISATGQCVQFRIGPLTRDFTGRLQIVVSGPPVLNPLWALEGSQDGGVSWFLVPAGTVPVLNTILGDPGTQYGPWYDILGMAGGSGTLFRFGCSTQYLQFATPSFQGAVTIYALVG